MFFSPLALEPISLVNYSSIIVNISIYSALFILMVLMIWIIRSRVVKTQPVAIRATWGCGYVAPNNRMQYTGKSFSKPFSKIFNFLLIEKKQYSELKNKEIFPKKRSYVSVYHDFFEYRLIKKITNRILYTANYFLFFQNGRTQSYVMYGILFIIVLMVLTFLNIIK